MFPENKILAGFGLAVLLFFASVQPAYAYLDPGTGSYFIQIVIGTVLGGGYILKKYWKEITTKFKQFNQPKKSSVDCKDEN